MSNDEILQQILKLLRDRNGDITDLKDVTEELVQSSTLQTYKIDQVLEMAKTHERILKGENSNPGLLEQHHEIKVIVLEDHELLHGDGDKPGIAEKVKEMHKFYTKTGKALWVIFGSSATMALKMLTELIK